MLSKGKKAFDKALADRIKFIRKGYVMPVDVVSVTVVEKKAVLVHNVVQLISPKVVCASVTLDGRANNKKKKAA